MTDQWGRSEAVTTANGFVEVGLSDAGVLLACTPGLVLSTHEASKLAGVLIRYALLTSSKKKGKRK